MRVSMLDQSVRNLSCQIDHLTDFEIAEDAMMRIAPVFAKQAEEQEDIAHTYAAIGKVGLRCPALAEQAGAIAEKHRVVMAQIVCSKPPSAGLGCMSAETEIAKCGARRRACGYGQAQRTPTDDRRGPAARRAIEPLA